MTRYYQLHISKVLDDDGCNTNAPVFCGYLAENGVRAVETVLEDAEVFSSMVEIISLHIGGDYTDDFDDFKSAVEGGSAEAVGLCGDLREWLQKLIEIVRASPADSKSVEGVPIYYEDECERVITAEVLSWEVRE